MWKLMWGMHMLKIKEYVRVESLEEAYELNQKKTNRILGGMLWMRMSNVQIQKGIDLSGLGLDKIEETDTEFQVGCMVTLRQLELHEGFNKYTNGIIIISAIANPIYQNVPEKHLLPKILLIPKNSKTILK